MGAAFYQSPGRSTDSINSPILQENQRLAPQFLVNNLRTMQCINCEKALAGRQTKFCSRWCKNHFGNNRFQSYTSQQERGRKRKIELVLLKGRKCQLCGYNRNFSALEFHHTDPGTKKFQLDLRSLSNRKWSAIICESMKCLLVCSNCHKEVHNPECALLDNFARNTEQKYELIVHQKTAKLV
jgi:hypothetical protein